MSAQAGVWDFGGKPVDPAFLERLSSAIGQCGPDSDNRYIDGPTGMVYRAFHTTLESHLERQPFVTARESVITWDGRLDNRHELIPQLSAALTDDQTDVAIVAGAFDRWDTDCFRRIIGDWAVSIWKPLERELILAIDYMAIRHIFYYPSEDRIWWSTDLAPLVLLSGDRFQIDDDYVAGHLAHVPDGHLTPYRQIRKVPPGHFVRVRSNGSVSVERHWRFNPQSRIRYKTDAEYEEHFRQVFRDSVHRRLRSDSPILADLSGGLDSSSIVCMADDILAKEGNLTPRLDTLSCYDKSTPSGEDWIYFPRVEEKRGRVGTHIDISKYGYSASLKYPQFAPRPGYLGTAENIVAERAQIMRSGGYRAILCGIGGDEFMGGIPDPRAHLADFIVQLKLIELVRQLLAWSLVRRGPWVQLLWESFLTLLPRSLGQYVFEEAKVEPWVDKEFAKRTRLGIRQADVDEHFGLWLPTRRSYVAGVLTMANNMSEHGNTFLADTRYPFLDQGLIEFILSIPASQLLRPGERRSLMRRALVGYVPQEILSRRTKQNGFRLCVVGLERNWEELQALFDSPLSCRLGYINRDKFLETANAVRNGKGVHISRLLGAVSLEFWLRDLCARRLIDIPPVGRSPQESEPSYANA